MDDIRADWPEELSRYLGEAIAAARTAKGMSAVRLSDETAALGMGVHRVAIPRIERGEQVVTVPELIALGMALEADWSRWLLDATEHADVRNSRGDLLRLEAALAELDHEIEAVTSQIAAARAALASTELKSHRHMREWRKANLESYEEILTSLHNQRGAVEELIRANRLASDRSSKQ